MSQGKKAEKAGGKLQEVRGALEKALLENDISAKAGRKENASPGHIWGQQNYLGSRTSQCKGPEAGVGLLEWRKSWWEGWGEGGLGGKLVTSCAPGPGLSL